MSQQLSSHASTVAELSTLYEMSSLSNLLSPDQLGHDSLEKALRLFGVRRFALWSGPPEARHLLAMSGLRNEDGALARARERADNIFAETLGADGELGLLFMEKSTPITPREKRIYDIFARRTEECLLTLSGDSERQRVIDALRESEDRYRALFELSSDAAYLVTLDGHLLEANQAWHDLFGYSQEELSNMTISDVYADPADRERIFLPAIARDGKILNWEVRFKKKGGVVMDCLCSVTARRDADGDIVHLQGLVRDVTEDKRRKDVLANELALRRILIEQSRDGIVVLDGDGKVAEANLSFAQMLGYSPEELLQLHVWDWDVPTSPSRLIEMAHTVDESGDHFETQHRRKDGTVYDVEISTNGVVFGDQKLIFCVCRDITARKQAEAALRESEQRFRSLFEHSMDAIWTLKPDGSANQVNQAWLDLFGYRRDDIPSLNAIDVYADPADREDFLRRIASSGVVRDEVRFKRKDGTVFDCERSVVALKDASGAMTGFQAILHDVTRRKADRAELQRSHDELRKLAAHLELVREEERATVAWELHDEVSQALSVINMDLQAIRVSLPAGAPAHAQAILDRIHAVMGDTVKRLRRLYTDLMPGMLDDLGLAATIEWQTSEVAKRSDIAFRIVRLDEVTLPGRDLTLAAYRAFMETLDNAMRHSGTTTIEVSVEKHERQAAIIVADNGRGITEKELRSPSSMGLIGIRERLSSVGGKIEIEGTTGKGTTVRITVPVE